MTDLLFFHFKVELDCFRSLNRMQMKSFAIYLDFNNEISRFATHESRELCEQAAIFPGADESMLCFVSRIHKTCLIRRFHDRPAAWLHITMTL